jgi:hypothetical protein
MEKPAPSPQRARRVPRRRTVRLVLLAAGVAMGTTCPYWPEDVAWLCVLVSRVAEVLHVG